ncbi:MAG: aldolase catalytic domain-containing protein [Dehalococcoidia bacterium]
MFRPQIKVLDCTVRDGGLINEHLFEDSFVKSVYDALAAAGIDYMEIGYKGSKKLFSPTRFGRWKFCEEDDIRRIVGDSGSSLKLSAMADVGKSDYHEDILPKSQSALDMIRIATYVKEVDKAIDMVKDAHDKGYETTVNIMAVSTVLDFDLNEALEDLAASEVETIYLVDSFGSLYSEQIQYMVKKYLKAVEGTGKQVGIHTHNNQQLAYANTIEAIIAGANRLDATIYGIGRGAGNCPLELLIGFLKNPKFNLRPVLEAIQTTFVPLTEKIEWGYLIPYALTGMFNQHPRSAIALRAGDDRDNYLKFYDEQVSRVDIG